MLVGIGTESLIVNTAKALPVRVVHKTIRYEMSAMDFAKKLVSPSDFRCLNYIWTKESHWNPNAKEPSTHALGIPQLEPITWRNLGYRKTVDPDAQVLAGLVYIYEHYGNSGICVAAKHSAHWGWY